MKNNSLKNQNFANLPALLLTLAELKKDLALKPNGRGARKLLVTELYPNKETIATESLWQASNNKDLPSLVLLGNNTELSIFNQYATQDRHYHKLATEIYLLLEGTMTIEVEGQDYILLEKDTIVINPGAIHLVKPGSENFLCLVISSNSNGISDKYVL